MKLKAKIQKLQTVVSDTNIDYISANYVAYCLQETGIDLDSVEVIVDNDDSGPIYENLGVQDIINGLGKRELVYIRSEIGQLLDGDQIQQILNEKVVKPTKEKRQSIYTLDRVTVDTLSNDQVDCLSRLFAKAVLSYGISVTLQSILPAFREYNNNAELRKKDLANWLIKTGVFVKNPFGLYTYINVLPLSEVEKQFPETEETLPGTVIEQLELV